jgi:LysM repeat protein
MQITHEQARKLIQFSLDGLLLSAEKATLSAHLQDCMDCSAYANELKDVETTLLPVMKKQWDLRPIPLSIDVLIQNKNSRINASRLLATRTAMIGVAVVALFFSAWQFVVSGPVAPNQLTLVVPPMPTPSVLTAQSTNTNITSEICEMVTYTVQGGDTLASIADRFSVSEDEIITINQLRSETVGPSLELVIPICNSTPTGTVNLATFTTTYTPIIKPTTSTPGG